MKLQNSQWQITLIPIFRKNITYVNLDFLYIRDRAFVANHRAITGREKPDCPTADRGQEPAPAGADAVHPLLNAHRWHPVGQQIGLTK